MRLRVGGLAQAEVCLRENQLVLDVGHDRLRERRLIPRPIEGGDSARRCGVTRRWTLPAERTGCGRTEVLGAPRVVTRVHEIGQVLPRHDVLTESGTVEALEPVVILTGLSRMLGVEVIRRRAYAQAR